MVSEAQARTRRLLEGMRKSGKLPPSIVFTGPEGSGKELLAVDLAAALNCDSSCEDHDRRCPSCVRTGNLEHPDLHMIYPVPYGEIEKSLPVVLESRREDFFNRGEFGNRARSIGINLIRRIIEDVSKQPFEGKHSVVILFEAHLTTLEAQNAFLKLLEEPPRSAVLVMITEFPDKLLPTILSRCREIRFEPLSGEVIARFLERFYSVEGEEARRLSKAAGGNLRRSIKLLDERFLGIRNDAQSLLKLVLGNKAKELLGESEAITRRYTREEVRELLDESVIMLRHLMRYLSGEGSDEESEMLERMFGGDCVKLGKTRDIPADIHKIHLAAGRLKRNADMEVTLSQLLLDLMGKWY